MSLPPTETPTRRMTNVSLYCILTLIIAYIYIHILTIYPRRKAQNYQFLNYLM